MSNERRLETREKSNRGLRWVSMSSDEKRPNMLRAVREAYAKAIILIEPIFLFDWQE